MQTKQLDLFTDIINAYVCKGILTNEDLYSEVLPSNQKYSERHPVGESGEQHNLHHRKIRWHQQTLKKCGVLQRVGRGVWQIKEGFKKEITEATGGSKLLAFSTNLGIAIWANQRSIFSSLDEPIHLAITSPPYPLRDPRNYGNPNAAEYVDFICNEIEPIVRNLVPGGSIVLNISNDIFEHKSPARSLYVERMVIALHDRLGLHLMDRMIWANYSKPPGPTYWACVNRVQLCTSYEPIFWFTNDPLKVRSDNRRVLEQHSNRHAALISSGGEQRVTNFGDGAYRLKHGSFSNETKGKIPKNILERGHSCADTKAYRAYAKELGLPLHGAMFPTSIPDFFVRFLTQPGELVVDPFGGTTKTGLAAERLGRRWIVVDKIAQYLRGGAGMFRDAPGYKLSPFFESAF